MAISSATITIFFLTVTILISFSGADYVLETNQRLKVGSSLEYLGNKLTMEEDCNLVAYGKYFNLPFWSSNTAGKGKDCYAIMQSDGNLVIYNADGPAVWASDTFRARGRYVLILGDHELTIYGRSIWDSGSWSSDSYAVSVTSGNTDNLISNSYDFRVLKSGEEMYYYFFITLVYGGYVLTMRKDCDLVLTDNGKQVWSTKTAGKGTNCYCSMQSDGNLVIYKSEGGAVWASNSGREEVGKYVLVLQKDRNLVIYGPAFWTKNGSKTTVSATTNTTSNNVVSSA